MNKYICKNCGATVEQGEYCLFCGFAVDCNPHIPKRKNCTARLSITFQEFKYIADEKALKEFVARRLISKVIEEANLDFRDVKYTIKEDADEVRFECSLEITVR